MTDASDAERLLAERRIREVNEAWATLQSPTARQAYDRTLLTPRRAKSPTPAKGSSLPAEADDDLVDVLPPMTALTAGLFRHLPWVIVAAVFALIFVLTAYASTDATSPDEPGGAAALEVGECIVIDPGPAARSVPCDATAEYQVVAQVAVAEDCPAGTEARRLQSSPQIECLRAA